MGDISSKSVAMLLVVTIVVALGGTYFTISAINQKLTSMGLTPITGFALTPNGTTTLTVQTTASITFTAASVNFGSGNVNTSGGFTNCSLKTVVDDQTKLNIGCESFTAVGNGFTIENDCPTFSRWRDSRQNQRSHQRMEKTEIRLPTCSA